MEMILKFFDMLLHLDKYIDLLIRDYGMWTYLIFFIIVFCETGLVVTPFLPGDSLLFVAGTFAALGSLNLTWLLVILSAAAILGDTINYWIGNYIGPKVFQMQNSRVFRKEYLDRTHQFYEKYGPITIVIGRFIPIIRTFAPFLAGVGSMTYGKFLTYNVVGGILWIASFTLGGYFFGNLPFVRKNFTAVIIAIIIISVMPTVIEYMRQRRQAKAARTSLTSPAKAEHEQ
jgi:membrane-associated protein